MIRELSVPELIEALHRLDSLLDVHIEVRAVDGFALAWRHVREHGLTADIDTITDDYPKSVMRAIERVGEQLGLGRWWLNNDAAADDAEFLIESMDLRWELVDCGFERIDLYICELESLLRLKLAALEDSQLSGRVHDLDDAVATLVKMGVTKDRFRNEYSYLQYDRPYAYGMILKAVW